MGIFFLKYFINVSDPLKNYFVHPCEKLEEESRKAPVSHLFDIPTIGGFRCTTWHCSPEENSHYFNVYRGIGRRDLLGWCRGLTS